jgi:hypothetical protein
MLISSEVNAAEAQTPGEDTRFYDDIGCLVRDPVAAKPSTQRFVRLANSTGWALADSAWFALSASAVTPMAHGLQAFTTEAEARAADRQGRARSWHDVVQEGQEQ